jgi:hypothetical protein
LFILTTFYNADATRVTTIFAVHFSRVDKNDFIGRRFFKSPSVVRGANIKCSSAQRALRQSVKKEDDKK